jgi:3-hydroxyisobutyrate dehydrogenase-like beta-hydroxyacid dehydrogenase
MNRRIGFIGVGIMGEPMCRNLALKSGASVIAYDRDRKPLARFEAHGVIAAVDASGALNADDRLRQAVEAGDGDLYFPVVSRLIGRKH